ncbi:MAG: SpoIID/LytB domain-containing protein [Clostridia bacterium]|nr:SpoIID/LytB domain-containing protein [Clostridia bacterium]
MKKITAIILSIVIAVLVIPQAPAYAAAQPVSVLKIGLSYGDNAVPAAKLQNVAGDQSGYQIGFYDSNLKFYPLITTYERDIVVIKDKSIWITSENEYVDVKPSSHKYYIGAYHAQVDATFATYNDAMALANVFTQMGYQAFPAFINGVFRLRVGEHLTYEKAQESVASLNAATGLSFTVVGGSETCYTVAITGTDKILFEFDSYESPMAALPFSTQTTYNKYKYNGGFEFRRVYGNDVTVINVVTMEQYIKGVIPYEVSPSWPLEAQKAQAICAKCYACNNLNKHASMGFDLCNTTDCQVYRGTYYATAVSNLAVDSVQGMYLTYDGEICMTYYHSNSGGSTENVENIWTRYIPYLRAVEDIYLKDPEAYTISVDLDTISEILMIKNYTKQRVIDYYVSRVSEAGNVLEVTFTQADGTPLRLTSDKARSAINSANKGIYIPSHRYTVTPSIGIYINKFLKTVSMSNMYAIGGDGTVTALPSTHPAVKAITSTGIKSVNPSTLTYIVSGTGSGHHVGMSQSGAYGMAKEGFTYDEILRFYYTGAQVVYYGY